MLFVLHRVYYNLLCTMACLCKTRTFSYQNDDFSREEESLFTSITSPAFLLLPTHFPRPYPIFFLLQRHHFTFTQTLLSYKKLYLEMIIDYSSLITVVMSVLFFNVIFFYLFLDYYCARI